MGVEFYDLPNWVRMIEIYIPTFNPHLDYGADSQTFHDL